MNYPLISDYIEAIKSAEDNFNELSYLRPVLGNDGQPVMSSGNFAVVFKMKDVRDGQLYAVRCFLRDQEGRDECYRLIEEELKDMKLPYLVSFHYIDKEIYVDNDQTDETEFPVLLMDWVEGMTLDKYIQENIKNKKALQMLSYNFFKLATWLIKQPFAHGDLKPDNILVKGDGSLVLVDYDGMFVPAMQGQKARELGSPDFRSPKRLSADFDCTIDDFSIISILLSLCMIHVKPSLLNDFGAQGRLLFSEKDYNDIENSQVYLSIPKYIFSYTNYPKLMKEACCGNDFSLSNKSCKLTVLRKPSKNVSPISKTKRKANVNRKEEEIIERNIDDVDLQEEENNIVYPWLFSPFNQVSPRLFITPNQLKDPFELAKAMVSSKSFVIPNQLSSIEDGKKGKMDFGIVISIIFLTLCILIITLIVWIR
jgi:serine/threonine protein kinase